MFIYRHTERQSQARKKKTLPPCKKASGAAKPLLRYAFLAVDEKKLLHDLASPLTALKMNLENMQIILADASGGPQPELEALLGSCLKQADRLAKLIGDRRNTLQKEP